ncbi:MAG: hypothetical protein EHM12_00450 [Dehalococcoidia bacterium]|nr:MAG: hypothetical protein EHM12_00450 [Dehalococcoidia bacterium]
MEERALPGTEAGVGIVSHLMIPASAWAGMVLIKQGGTIIARETSKANKNPATGGIIFLFLNSFVKLERIIR